MNYREISKYDRNNVKVFSGIPAAPGYAIGKVFIYEREKYVVNPAVVLDFQSELESFNYAIEKSKKELVKIINTSREKIGQEHAVLFEAHLLILDDETIIGPIVDKIRNDKHTAEYAVDTEFNKYLKSFKTSDDAMSMNRANEFEDVKMRLIRNLQRKRWESKLIKNVIIASHNLTPADTILLSRNEVLAYVSEIGGLASHTAIISRSLNIPAVVGIHDVISHLKEDSEIIVDGFDGFVIINPDNHVKNIYENKIIKLKENREKLKGFENNICCTKDNKRVYLSCNLEFLHEIQLAKTFHTDGIGLYRSESIFFEKGYFPDEAEQIDKYLNFAQRIFPEKIIIRTFDIGGDKVLPEEIEEKNPFLGWRGIRMMLDEKDIFKTQIKAILKSSLHQNVQIMIPMVTKLEEVQDTKKVIEEVKKELRANNQKFDENILFGIMAEVPSIVYIIEDISKEVDFISVGTNDLIQYTLAVDRGNEIVSKYYKEFNPSVLRILNDIVKGTHKNKKKISICGEMASDLLVVPFLVGIGFDELSVSIHNILKVKKYISHFKSDELYEIAKTCLSMKYESEIEKYLRNIYNKKSGDILE